jgi:hypothetical protein
MTTSACCACWRACWSRFEGGAVPVPKLRLITDNPAAVASMMALRGAVEGAVAVAVEHFLREDVACGATRALIPLMKVPCPTAWLPALVATSLVSASSST